jgi:hypothetical protein
MTNKYEFEYNLCKLYDEGVLSNIVLNETRCDQIINSIENPKITKEVHVLMLSFTIVCSIFLCIMTKKFVNLAFDMISTAWTAEKEEKNPLSENLIP